VQSCIAPSGRSRASMQARPPRSSRASDSRVVLLVVSSWETHARGSWSPWSAPPSVAAADRRAPRQRRHLDDALGLVVCNPSHDNGGVKAGRRPPAGPRPWRRRRARPVRPPLTRPPARGAWTRCCGPVPPSGPEGAEDRGQAAHGNKVRRRGERAASWSMPLTTGPTVVPLAKVAHHATGTRRATRRRSRRTAGHTTARPLPGMSPRGVPMGVPPSQAQRPAPWPRWGCVG